MNRDPGDFVLDELARHFRKLLSAKCYVDPVGNTIVDVDFSGVPRKYKFALPGRLMVVEYEDPPVVKMIDLIKDTLPGLYGYVVNSGAVGKMKICTCCGKEHKK